MKSAVCEQPVTHARRARHVERMAREGGWPRLRGWLVPPRIQAFEFCDQPWLRGVWREAYMDGLNFLFRLGRVYHRMHRPFSRWARAAGNARVLDLGSGGAGHVRTLMDAARRERVWMPRVILSDLHPNPAAFEALKARHPDRIGYLAEPVDALEGGKGHARLLSVCTAFHHFPPRQAARLLRSACETADGLFIMEVMPRSWRSAFMPLLNVIPLMLAPFFAERFMLRKAAVTTLLPIIPLMIIFDGVVSALRAYRNEEILALLPEDARKAWHWEGGGHRYLGVMEAPYLFGFRKRNRAARSPPGDAVIPAPVESARGRVRQVALGC